jgi:hypothetical protein
MLFKAVEFFEGAENIATDYFLLFILSFFVVGVISFLEATD